jgi:organic hydroperoxide reductase OsmC/OhrA
MARNHTYELEVVWTGNTGSGTSGHRSYQRAHEVRAAGKPAIAGSSDPAFRGDPTRWNPEELLVASLSQCHMLWYLALCAQHGVVVTDYADRAAGTMAEDADGGGRFTEVVLRPRVQIADPATAETATALHEQAHHLCFIANSVNFAVRCEPVVSATPIVSG